jgi:uncharacterized protein (DUF1810 family)
MSESPAIDLDRFVEAQKNSHERAKQEMLDGHKATHWIWWTLPIIQKRERTSRNNVFYAIRSLEEAKAYLDHSVLGPRLLEMTEIILRHQDADIDYLMGKNIDTRKLQSCMTLFSLVAGSRS